MFEVKQKIRTVLIPESGINLEPLHVVESLVDTDFIRSLAHIVGQSPGGAVILKCTSGGDLRVAMIGTGFEVYEVEAGVAPDAYNAGSTYTFAVPVYTTDLLIETFDATISFRNVLGVWGDNKSIPIGAVSIDLLHYGIRIQNRVALSVAAYEITMYR